MNKRIRIEDIAKYCGCSTATVARVVRNTGYVSEEKSAKIKAAMLKLGYVPRKTHNSTVHTKTRFIALFMLSGDQPLFGRFADGIFTEASKRGYHVLTFHVDSSYSAESIVDTIETLRQNDIQGIIFNALGDEIDFLSIRHYLQSLDLPIVMVERVADIYNINKVLINAREGMFLAVRHLHDAGHKQIVLFSPDRTSRVEEMRIEGFLSAAAAFDIHENCKYVDVNQYTESAGYAAIEAYLRTNPLPSAIIAADCVLAGIMQYFYTHQIRVPEDVSVVGMDDTYSRLLAPPITTVSFPEAAMCQTAIELIVESSEKKQDYTSREIFLSPSLIVRDSVSAPRK